MVGTKILYARVFHMFYLQFLFINCCVVHPFFVFVKFVISTICMVGAHYRRFSFFLLETDSRFIFLNVIPVSNTLGEVPC